MESGASAHRVEEIVRQVAGGLGAERVELRVGYSSLALTLSIGPETITRIRKVLPPGVNEDFYQALQLSAYRIAQGGLTSDRVRSEFDRLVRESSRHSDWVIALAAGTACGAIGRLLDADWAGIGPIFAASAVAQFVRRRLAVRHVNTFLSTALVALIASSLSALGARWAGSQTVTRDMIASVLMLVPGIPAFNAQADILEGHPTLGSARAVWVAVILLFMALGVWMALGILGQRT
jgi:uncharacterized membrane protein YjjP (DUF1212 family)